MLQGRLENGLRYAVLPRRSNEPGVGLLMRVEGGFIAERRPGERGLAHLIEHIVFHSPTRTAPDELRRFRGVGLPVSLPERALGTTSWRESDYVLMSRTTKPADLDILLGLYREVFSELTFRADAVDGQRAEVLREMADKKLGNDVYAAYIAAVAPGSPTDVIDAQNSDDVPVADVETIRALYHRLYRPENTMVVIVGDVDPAQVEPRIRRRFGEWRGVGPAPGRVPPPTFRSDRLSSISHSSLKHGRNVAMMTVATPLPPPRPSRKLQAEAMLMDMLAIRAVNNRLALARTDYPPGKYGSFIENGEQGHRLIILWDDFVPGRWRTACALETAGLSEAEWTTAKRNLMDELEQRTKDMVGAPNLNLAQELANALTHGRHLLPPNELLGYARDWLPTIDAQVSNAWWHSQWRAGIEHIRVESPDLAGGTPDPQAAIRTALAEAGCKV